MKIKKSLFALFINLCALQVLVYAQNDVNMWYQYVMSAKLDKKNFTFLSQYRSFDLAPDPRLFLAAGALDFDVTKNIRPGFGLMYLNLQSYIGNTDNKRIRNEIRPYQYVSIRGKINNLSYTNRLLLEERFLSNPNLFLLRVRYRIAVRVPLQKNGNLYGNIMNELMVNMVNADFFDRDRVTLNIGLKISKNSAIEVGYINELRTNNNGQQYAHIGFRNNFDWRKSK